MPALVPTIGLEVHVQLATRTRLLSSGPVPGQPEAEDTPLDAICAGHPGTMPVLGAAAVALALRAALALGCAVQPESRFDRKHYSWPDLPKGYQVTQERHPLARDGQLWVEGPDGPQPHRITRLHLEEDAAVLRHRPGATLVHLARSGVPLVEIVGAPDLRSPAQAEAWARMLRRTLVAAGVTAGHLDLGHLRIDANLSLAPPGAPPGTRVELKNLGSFRVLRQALEEEQARQEALLTAGGSVRLQTRRWDGQHLQPLRDKAEGRGYAFLPEPDLPPLRIDAAALAQAAGALAQAAGPLPAPPGPDRPLSRWLLDQDAATLAALHATVPGLGADEARLLAAAPVLAERVRQAALLAPSAALQAARLAVYDLRPDPHSDPDAHSDPDRLTAEHLAQVAQAMEREGRAHGLAVTALRAARRTGALPPWTAGEEAELQAALQQVVQADPEHEARWRQGNRGMEGYFMGQAARILPASVDRRALHRLLVALLEARRGA